MPGHCVLGVSLGATGDSLDAVLAPAAIGNQSEDSFKSI